MQLPGFVDSHSDEKDYELAFHFSRHTGTNYFCHTTSSLPELPIRGPVLFQNSIRGRSWTEFASIRKLYTAYGAMGLTPTGILQPIQKSCAEHGILPVPGPMNPLQRLNHGVTGSYPRGREGLPTIRARCPDPAIGQCTPPPSIP